MGSSHEGVQDMAKKPQREIVEEIVKNLVDSEISGIQAVAKDMAARVRQLEEHSERIKKYADEIEKLALNAASEKYDKASLDDLIKNLEKTLTKLRKKHAESEDLVQPAARPGMPVAEKKKEYVRSATEKIEVDKSEAASKLRQPLYTTPEGFVVRKTRG